MVQSRSALLSLVDQAGYSGITFLFFFYLSVTLEGEELGVYSLSFAVSVFFQGVVRNVIVIPMMISDGYYREYNKCFTDAINLMLLLLPASFLVSALLCSLSGGNWLEGGMLSALLLFSMTFYEIRRRYYISKSSYILNLKLLSLFIILVLFLLSIVRDWSTYVYPLSLILSVLVFRGFGGEYLNGTTIFSRLWKRRYEVAAGIVYGGYNNFIVLFVGVLGGAAAAGGFSVVRNFMQPVQVLISGFDSIDKASAASEYYNKGVVGLLRSLYSTILACLSLCMIYLLLLNLFWEWISSKFYEEYNDVDLSGIVLIMTVSYLFMVVGHFLESGLYIMNLGRKLFTFRFVAFVCSLFFVFCFWDFLGVHSSGWAMLIGWSIVVFSVVNFYAKTVFKM